MGNPIAHPLQPQEVVSQVDEFLIALVVVEGYDGYAIRYLVAERIRGVVYEEDVLYYI